MMRELEGEDEVIPIPKKVSKAGDGVPTLRYRSGSLSEKAAQAALAAGRRSSQRVEDGDGAETKGGQGAAAGAGDKGGGATSSEKDDRKPLQHLEEQEDGTFAMCDILNENEEPVVWRSLGGACAG